MQVACILAQSIKDASDFEPSKKTEQMFKVVHSSDHHHGLETDGVIDAVTSLNTRTLDGLRALDDVVDYVIANNVNLYIISGDVFNTKTIAQTVVNAFFERIKKLSDAGVQVIILNGNHDASRILQTKNGLDVASTLDVPNVMISRGNDYFDFGSCQVVTTNYWNSPEEVAEQIQTFSTKVDWSRPAILVGHHQVDYPGSLGAFKEDLTSVPLAAFTSHPWTAVLLGHIHAAQMLSENPPVWYGGSLVRCTAAEAKQKKGFWTFDIDGTKVVNLQQVEVKCLKYVNIRGTMSQIVAAMDNKSPDLSNCIVKITIVDDGEPLDEAFIRARFGNTFKTKVERESAAILAPKLSAVSGMSMDAYLSAYFDEDKDKYDLLSLVANLRIEDEGKVTER